MSRLVPAFAVGTVAAVAALAAAWAFFPQALPDVLATPVTNPTAISQLDDDGWPDDDYYHQAARLCGTGVPMRKVGAPRSGWRFGDDRYTCGPGYPTGDDWYLWSFVHSGRYCSMVHKADAECAKEITDADAYFTKRDAEYRARPA